MTLLIDSMSSLVRNPFQNRLALTWSMIRSHQLFIRPRRKRSIETNMLFACNSSVNPTIPLPRPQVHKQPHLNLIPHLLAPKHKPHQLISATAPPQITPTRLVFWQGRVKVRSGLTLPNEHQHWQPLRVGLSKTAANRIATQTSPIIIRTSNDLRR